MIFYVIAGFILGILATLFVELVILARAAQGLSDGAWPWQFAFWFGKKA